MTPELGEAPRDGNTMNSEHYRHLAEEEAALAKTAVSNTSRAQHYGCLLQPLGGRERKVSDRGGSHDQKRKHRHVGDGHPQHPPGPPMTLGNMRLAGACI